MTTSESNITAINTSRQLLTSNSSKNQPVDIVEQSMSGLTTLGESFSAIFSGAKGVKETMSKPAQGNEQLNSIDIMQQGIFSSLGLGNLSSEGGLSTIDLLTSKSSIESLQTSLLSVLQTSLFSALPENNVATNNVATNNVETNNNCKTTHENKAEIIEKTEATETTKVTEITKVTEYSTMNDLSKFTFGEDGIDSKDGFDVFNIMHQIPVVSAFYQDVSGQDISLISKLSGSYLYGGAIGVAVSALDLAVESYTGTSMSKTIIDFDYASLFNNDNVGQSDLEGQEVKTSNEALAEYFPLAKQMASRTQK
jgi:hypothetical protein